MSRESAAELLKTPQQQLDEQIHGMIKDLTVRAEDWTQAQLLEKAKYALGAICVWTRQVKKHSQMKWIGDGYSRGCDGGTETNETSTRCQCGREVRYAWPNSPYRDQYP